MFRKEEVDENGHQLYSICGKLIVKPRILSGSRFMQFKILDVDGDIEYLITVDDERQKILCGFVNIGEFLMAKGIFRCDNPNKRKLLAKKMYFALSA